MELHVQSGKYVTAVSGGVDSVALLDLLTKRSDLQLCVAHFDHGIRPDSDQDRLFVQMLAESYGLPFVYETAALGPQASEAAARMARYTFLHRVRKEQQAHALITAHHQDDVLETVLLNLLRGTDRRGLTSLAETDTIRRPLLAIPKQTLRQYALDRGLTWHEDSTNADDRYARNYVRRHLISQFDVASRERLLAIVARTRVLNATITQQLINYLHCQPDAQALDRYGFTNLPHAVAREVMAEWLVHHTGAERSRVMLERLVTAAKTGRSGTSVDIDGQYRLVLSRTLLALKPQER